MAVIDKKVQRAHRHLRIHIRRKARVWQRLDIDSRERTFSAGYHDRLVELLNDNTHFAQLRRDSFQMLGDDVVYVKLAACRSGGDHKGARLNHIGNNRIFTAMQRFHTIDFNDIGTFQ